MSSTEISMLVGQQNQMMAGQMQHAAMLSQQVGARQTMGEQTMGQAVNVGMGVGAPLAAGAAAIAGVDPMSLAARGVIGTAMGGSAVAGAGLVAGGAVAGVGLMAAQYTAKQMTLGMQQQQQLNAALRQNYGFMGASGRGFGTEGMQNIGQMIRQQSMTRAGPGGQYMGFEELGTLASRMGQMGMGRGVRDAFEFNEKFKTMLGQVKEIAEAFNTSLEEAQKIMTSMRGSGIFRNQGQIAQQIRTTAMGGGLAASEVTGMMAVGSQMSRMLGGRGSAGAAGGMKTIGQIGMAMESGVLDDETLYDLTGQTGVAGRRTLATRRMQQSARFLRGGLGRRMIASMAGADGTLDEESAQEVEAGGVGTGRTMAMAHRNLGKVGRANFIRNEGRLRGEVLGRFGGLAPIAMMSSWLEQRGKDPTSDRGEIFMSRRLGMSVEEVRQQMHEYRRMQFMESTREDRMQDIEARGDIEKYQQSTGMQGIKRKLEDARNKVQGTLRQAGADFYAAGSDMIEKWFNKMTGQFVSTVDRDIGQAIREASSGFGATSDRVWEERFGGGRGVRGQKIGEDLLRSLGGQTQRTGMQAFLAAGDDKRYEEAGWGTFMNRDFLKGRGGTDAVLADQIAAVERVRTAGLAGGSMIGTDDVQLPGGELVKGAGAGDVAREWGAKRSKALLNIAGTGGFQGQGMDFINRFGGVFKGDAAMESRWKKADAEEKARIVRDVSEGAGITATVNTAMGRVERRGMFGGGFATERERQDAIGGFLSESGMTEEERAWKNEKFLGFTKGDPTTTGLWEGGKTRGEIVEGAVGGLASLAFGAYDKLFGGAISDMLGKGAKDLVEGQVGLDSSVRRSAVAFSETERGRDAMQAALSRDPKRREKVIQDAMRRNESLLARAGNNTANMNRTERGEFEFNTSLRAAEMYAGRREELGRELNEEEQKELFKEMTNAGIQVQNVEDMVGRANLIAVSNARNQTDSLREMVRREGERAEKWLGGAERKGSVRGGKLTADAMKAFANVGQRMRGAGTMVDAAGNALEQGPQQPREALTTGQAMAQFMTEAMELRRRAAQTSDPNEQARLTDEARSKEGESRQILSGMSSEEMRAQAKTYREQGLTGAAREMEGIEKLGSRAVRSARFGDKARVGQQFGQMLGLRFKNSELAKMRGMDTDEMAAAFAEKGGFGDDEKMQEQLKAALAASKAGRVGEAGQLMGQLTGQFAEKEREERYSSAKKDDPTVRAIQEVKDAITEGFGNTMTVTVDNAHEIGGTPSAEGGGGGGGGNTGKRMTR